MPQEAPPSCISSTDLIKQVGRYMNDQDIEKVNRAYLLANQAHDGVIRKSGEAYIFHPIVLVKKLQI